jgi:hypothetical protein
MFLETAACHERSDSVNGFNLNKDVPIHLSYPFRLFNKLHGAA